MTRTGSSHIAPNSAARWDMRLVAGRAQRALERSGWIETAVHAAPRGGSSRGVEAWRRRPVATRRDDGSGASPGSLSSGAAGRRRRRGVSAVAHARTTSRPRSRTSRSACSATTPPRIHSATVPCEPGSRDKGPCPRCRSSHARGPARSRPRSPGGWGRARAARATSPPARSDFQQAPAVLAGGVVPVAMPSSSPPASWSRTPLQPRDHVVDRGHQRVGVGAVDPAPHDRVRARHAGDVAKRRAGGRQPLALGAQHARGLRDEHVGQHVREVRRPRP